MLKNKLLAVASLAFLLCAAAAHVPARAAGHIYKPGDHIADFAFKGDDGKTVKLSQFKGKVVVLTFFATWCPGCNDEAPHLDKDIWRAFKAKNVQVLALSANEAAGDPHIVPMNKIREFRKRHAVTYPILSDEHATILEKFGVDLIPAMVIIDKNGRYVSEPRDLKAVAAGLRKLTK